MSVTLIKKLNIEYPKLGVKNKVQMALVRCDYCGKEFKMAYQHIKTRQSCGCMFKRYIPKCKVKVGETYGYLTILAIKEPEENAKNRSRTADCRCICGGLTNVRVDRLLSKAIISCGCLRGMHERKKNKIYQENDYTVIETSNGKKILVDNADVDKLSYFCWSISSGRTQEVHTRMDNKLISMHRFLMQYPKESVDHINHNTLDNRSANLRLATVQQNNQNKISIKGTSKYKGVYKKGSKWAVKICNNYLGTFTDEEEAAKVYNIAATKLFKEFAFLNKIEESDE